MKGPEYGKAGDDEPEGDAYEREYSSEEVSEQIKIPIPMPTNSDVHSEFEPSNKITEEEEKKVESERDKVE